MHDDYTLIAAPPAIDDYRRLRVAAGLSAKSAEAAARGLPNTLFGVRIERAGSVVGMGRVIGDGGCFYQVVDIAVDPAHQGRGLGKRIVAALVDWQRDNIPDSAYVSLIADGQAHALYAQYGFAPTAPASIGMALRRRTGQPD
ncbi:GNAT family N-acetyltransferase [Neisseriaceae bacterium JH1-16]|nr:GNAT family N-acetyltransferase [Neisseriaceae bacterium JH1-16]